MDLTIALLALTEGALELTRALRKPDSVAAPGRGSWTVIPWVPPPSGDLPDFDPRRARAVIVGLPSSTIEVQPWESRDTYPAWTRSSEPSSSSGSSTASRTAHKGQLDVDHIDPLAEDGLDAESTSGGSPGRLR